jgi:hypothetical protein
MRVMKAVKLNISPKMSDNKMQACYEVAYN